MSRFLADGLTEANVKSWSVAYSRTSENFASVLTLQAADLAYSLPPCRKTGEVLATFLVGLFIFPLFFWWQTKVDPIDALIKPRTWSVGTALLAHR